MVSYVLKAHEKTVEKYSAYLQNVEEQKYLAPRVKYVYITQIHLKECEI